MSIISAGTTSDSSIKFIANSDGTLTLKTNDNGSSGGTTALTLATNQAATFASSVSATTVSASTAVVQGGAAANYAGNFRDATVGGSCYLQITTNASGSANTDGFVWGLDTASPPNAYLSQKENANLYLQANSATVATLTGGGNLGVGVTSPISKLAVATASNTSDLGATGLTIGGATTLTSGNVLMLNFTPIGADSNRARAGIGCEVGADWGKGNLTFYTRDASNSSAMTTADERMRIDSNGYVGIGTTSPLQKVQIAAPSSSGNISPALAFSQGGSGSGTGTSLWLGYGAENTKSVAISGFYDGAGMTMAFYTTPTAASTAFSERMRIDSSGVVRTGSATTSGASSGDICLPNNIALRGANTTNLASRTLAYVDTGNFAAYGDASLNGVKITGNTAVTGTGGGAYVGQFTNSNSTSYGLYVAAGGGGSRQIAYFADYLGNPSVSIQSTALWVPIVGSSAVFQIGSTTQGRVNGTSIGGISYYSNASNTGTLDIGSVNSAPDQINFYTSSGFAGKISSSGTSTTYGTSSDYRLKDEITDLTGSGAFIDALRPVTGKWKADGSDFTGFIAHEFALVSPSSVSGGKDAVDADGNPVYQSMQASSPEVMAHVVAELKSLRTRVAALESR